MSTAKRGFFCRPCSDNKPGLNHGRCIELECSCRWHKTSQIDRDGGLPIKRVGPPVPVKAPVKMPEPIVRTPTPILDPEIVARAKELAAKPAGELDSLVGPSPVRTKMDALVDEFAPTRVECVTCGKPFNGLSGMAIHHQRAHKEPYKKALERHSNTLNTPTPTPTPESESEPTPTPEPEPEPEPESETAPELDRERIESRLKELKLQPDVMVPGSLSADVPHAKVVDFLLDNPGQWQDVGYLEFRAIPTPDRKGVRIQGRFVQEGQA